MQRNVFISHSSKDAGAAQEICEYFEARGLTCWMAPRDVMAGMDWDEEILKALGSCSVLLVVCTRMADESRQVKREIISADTHDMPILPVRIENFVFDHLQYHLSTPHWFDAFDASLEVYLDPLADTVTQWLERLGVEPERRPSRAVVPALARTRMLAQARRYLRTDVGHASLQVLGLIAVVMLLIVPTFRALFGNLPDLAQSIAAIQFGDRASAPRYGYRVIASPYDFLVLLAVNDTSIVTLGSKLFSGDTGNPVHNLDRLGKGWEEKNGDWSYRLTPRGESERYFFVAVPEAHRAADPRISITDADTGKITVLTRCGGQASKLAPGGDCLPIEAAEAEVLSLKSQMELAREQSGQLIRFLEVASSIIILFLMSRVISQFLLRPRIAVMVRPGRQ